MQTNPTQNPLALARTQIDAVLSDQDWSDIWKGLRNIALHAENTGHRINAARFLCEYRFGKPASVVEHVESAPDATPIPKMPVPVDHPDYPLYWAKTILDDSEPYQDDDAENDDTTGDLEPALSMADASALSPSRYTASQAPLASDLAASRVEHSHPPV